MFVKNFIKSRSGLRQCIRSYTEAVSGDKLSPLAGIRILDLTRVLAGPYCSMILGDLGAEVIKVERPGIGDDTRSWGPPYVGSESCYFFSVNRNKKSIAVDLKTKAGMSILKKLAVKCDVLIENYVPGQLERMNLDYPVLSELNPKLIYCSITGFGSSGPYRSRAGYDVIAASIGGLLHITGSEGGEPCKVGVAMTDLATGLYAHGAIMAALLQRQHTHKGQRIECNLLSTQVACLVNMASNYLNGGFEPADRCGTAHASIVPYQAFLTADGRYLTVGAGNNPHFQRLCHILELDHIACDTAFETNEKRVANRSKLLPQLAERFRARSLSDWLDLFEKNKCKFPYGPINNLKEVFNDPHVKFSKQVVEMDHSNGSKIKLVGPAVAFSDSNNSCREPPPTLGQHTDFVLGNILNYSEREISNFRSEKVIQ